MASAVEVASVTRRASETAAARSAGRLGLEYVLRTLQLLAAPLEGDILLGIVAGAIVVANAGHLDRAGADPRYSELDELPPDAVRKPVTVRALAGSLGIPYETTRRYVNRLTAMGVCLRVEGGIIATAAALGGGASHAALAANLVNLRRLCRNLRRVGAQID